MIKIAEINAFNFGSTGNIMYNIANLANKKGLCVKTFSPKARMTKKHSNDDNVLFGSILERRGCERIARFLPLHDQLNYFATKKLLKELNKFSPDILHFHNLHGDYINLKMLFSYINKKGISVVWTFHDCWPITGHCPYFTYQNCDKWKTQCYNCPQFKKYPSSYFDDSKRLYKLKKQIFTSLNDCTIVTPSLWLKNIVSNSFLSKYNTVVINNGINLNNFKPIDSNFREKYNLQNKYIILGVAFLWDERKGLDRLMNLANELDENYQIVVVGTIPFEMETKKIINIPRTADQNELAEIYSAANILVNPTYEDNFPTVNIESLACGTPVLTYNTGGSPEIINEETGEIVNDDTLKDAVKRWCSIKKPVDLCVNKAQEYDMNKKFKEYIDLYEKLKKTL